MSVSSWQRPCRQSARNLESQLRVSMKVLSGSEKRPMFRGRDDCDLFCLTPEPDGTCTEFRASPPASNITANFTEVPPGGDAWGAQAIAVRCNNNAVVHQWPFMCPGSQTRAASADGTRPVSLHVRAQAAFFKQLASWRSAMLLSSSLFKIRYIDSSSLSTLAVQSVPSLTCSSGVPQNASPDGQVVLERCQSLHPSLKTLLRNEDSSWLFCHL